MCSFRLELHEEGRHRLLVVDAADGLRKERGHRQHVELPVRLLRRKGNRVGDDDLFDGRVLDARDGGTGEHAVHGGGDDAPRAFALERIHRLEEGARGIDHVVDDHHVLVLDLADQVHEDGHVGPVAPLVDDGKAGLEPLGDGPRALHAPRIRRDEDELFQVLLRQIVDDHGGRREEVIHRHVEEALDLPGVEIHGKDAVAARGGDEVRNELGRDGDASHHLAILAAVAVVGKDRGDAPGRRALEGVQHHQKLHEVVVHGRAGGLDHEDVLAADDHLMELLVMLDAFKRASAGRITAVLPYYGYGRQDRKVMGRVPITAKLVADLITAAGCHRILAVDLHAGQIQGFFNMPVDHLFAAPPVIVDYLAKKDLKDLVLVSPDAGGVERARAIAKRLKAGLAIIDKRRDGANVAVFMHLIGDVRDKDVVIIDDMIDTAGTLLQAVDALKREGARRIIAAAVHGVLSGPAIARIESSPIEEVIITNTIPLTPEKANRKFHVLSVAPLLAEAIRRIHDEESVSTLFV